MLDYLNKTYVDLTNFIDNHPEIDISENIISIPENVRPEFYRLFNAVRTAVIEESLPDEYHEAQTLSRNYISAEQEVKELLGLDGIQNIPSLGRFLHDPLEEMIKPLFDPLFSLLKAKASVTDIAEEVIKNTEEYFHDLYPRGYEIWIILSLVKLLEADELLRVTIRHTSPAAEYPTSGNEPVPAPQKSNCLSFDHQRDCLLSVPDLIIHSAILGKYVSARVDVKSSMKRAINSSDKREWNNIGLIAVREPGIILIYVADEANDLSLVGDVDKICRPDLILECRCGEDWFEREGMNKIDTRRNNLNPTLGTFVLSEKPVLEQAYAETMSTGVTDKTLATGVAIKPTEIRPLTIGFDQLTLEPVIDAMKD